jgi:signal peptidase I
MAMKFLQNNRLFILLSGLSRLEKTVVIVLVAVLLLGSLIPGRLIVAVSDSLDHRIFFMTGFNRKAIKTGDYIVFQGDEREISAHTKPMIDKNLDRMIKKVGCASGDMLVHNDQGEFYCNGCFVGKALETDSLKRPLPQFQFSGVVPKESYFMIGTNPRSYDSRYFGFIAAEKILYKALPLW